MVVDDLDLLGALTCPTESDAVALIDPDAVLATAVATEALEPIARRSSQVIEKGRRLDLVQLAAGDRPQRRGAGSGLARSAPASG